MPPRNATPPAATRAGLPRLVRHAFYPAALALTLCYVALEARGHFGPTGSAYPFYLAGIVGSLLLLEWRLPLRPAWGMSWHSLLQRDLPMMALNGAAIAATTHLVSTLADVLPRHATPAIPWWLQAALAVLGADFLWYWVHRCSHEGSNALGRWLWKTHVHHHLPAQVYVLMHPVAHPLNSVYVRLILLFPGLLLGLSPQALFAATVLTGFQGLLSHCNVDIRAGWLNHLLVGTELHRYHHGAGAGEGRNYGAVTSLWDQIFGTFDYRPGRHPDSLGVRDRSAYPADRQWLALLTLPFR